MDAELGNAFEEKSHHRPLSPGITKTRQNFQFVARWFFMQFAAFTALDANGHFRPQNHDSRIKKSKFCFEKLLEITN